LCPSNLNSEFDQLDTSLQLLAEKMSYLKCAITCHIRRYAEFSELPTFLASKINK